MAVYKDLLSGCRIASAGKRRKCYHSPKHSILKGQVCLEVRAGLGYQGYCKECAFEMLQRARSSVDALSESFK